MSIKHNFRGNYKARTKIVEKPLHNSPTRKLKEYECCLCGQEMHCSNQSLILENNFKTAKIFGHNAEPISKGHGRCCGTCNYTKVITARLQMMGINKDF